MSYLRLLGATNAGSFLGCDVLMGDILRHVFITVRHVFRHVFRSDIMRAIDTNEARLALALALLDRLHITLMQYTQQSMLAV